MELQEHFAKEEKELFPAMLKEDKTPEERAAIERTLPKMQMYAFGQEKCA